MNDSTIIRLATETARHLQHAVPVSSAPYMVPSYNALLAAAQANHPGDVFLKALQPLPVGENGERRDDESISMAEIRALFAQVAIALESIQGEGR